MHVFKDEFWRKKWEIFTKISEIFRNFCNIYYGTPEKTTTSVQILRQGTPLGSVFWYHLGHNPATGYPARVLFYTPPPPLFIVRPNQ